MRIRTGTVSLALLAAAGGLAACTSSGGAAATSSPPPPASTSTVSSPVPVTSTVTSTAGSTSPDGAVPSTTRCAESQLRASAKLDTIAGVDAHVVRLQFANISDNACTLTGYPGAAIEDGSNKQVQQAKRLAGGPVGGTIEKVRTVTIEPGRSAYAYLEGSSTREQGAAQAGCDGPKYPRILVTPPNTDTPVPFTVGWPQCTSFRVHPVRID